MPEPLDHPRLLRQLHSLLMTRGPLSSRDACAVLSISQPSFSRLINHVDDMVRIGRGRSTRYAVRRAIRDVATPASLHRVDRSGRLTQIGLILPIEPDLLLFQMDSETTYDDLPWFLQDVRPLGYLGRQVPGRHPELGLPPDIRLWSTEHVLAYLSTAGWNVPGDLILGDEAARRYLSYAAEPPDAVAAADRVHRYPMIASGTLRHGPAGSSAAGEQPKFLVTRVDPSGPTPVIVKFSPPVTSPLSQRVADLLVCEHLALESLRASGHAAARSQVLELEGRSFLEVERFDRIGWPGRRGVVSLEALNGAFTGVATDWVHTTEALVRAKIVPADVQHAVAVRHAFGQLIGNTDMHFGNLSFFTEQDRVVGLAPTYDMLPACFAPRGQELVPYRFLPPTPHPSAAWRAAWEMAGAFWRAASEDTRISVDFRQVARSVGAAMEAQRSVIRLLPF